MGNNLAAGVVFSEASKPAQDSGAVHGLEKKEMEHFESLLDDCQSQKIMSLLTEDENKKVKLWRMTITTLVRQKPSFLVLRLLGLEYSLK